ncbi:MAG: hypothetical protein J1F35_05305 [Erysipelotrichales bacterium]|nr:hypothetical protein [Erysipelotrichales bacterium]
MDIITYDDLLAYYDEHFKLVDKELFRIVINEFLDIIGEKINFENDDYITLATSIKRYFFYESEYVELWFDLLKKHNYSMKSEIKDIIDQLTSLPFPNLNKRLIKKLLKSPVVDDISYNGKGGFTIISPQYGEIKLMHTKEVFKDIKQVKKYMKDNITNCCHDNTYYLSGGFLNMYSITSLANHYFNHPFYHSYTYDKEIDCVIDLSLKCAMEKKTYDLIIEPKEIIMIQNRDIPQILANVESKTEQPEKRCQLLKIALYEQLNNISAEEINKILTYKNSIKR